MVARKAHNLEVGGSTPSPATFLNNVIKFDLDEIKPRRIKFYRQRGGGTLFKHKIPINGVDIGMGPYKTPDKGHEYSTGIMRRKNSLPDKRGI